MNTLLLTHNQSTAAEAVVSVGEPTTERHYSTGINTVYFLKNKYGISIILTIHVKVSYLQAL